MNYQSRVFILYVTRLYFLRKWNKKLYHQLYESDVCLHMWNKFCFNKYSHFSEKFVWQTVNCFFPQNLYMIRKIFGTGANISGKDGMSDDSGAGGEWKWKRFRQVCRCSGCWTRKARSFRLMWPPQLADIRFQTSDNSRKLKCFPCNILWSLILNQRKKAGTWVNGGCNKGVGYIQWLKSSWGPGLTVREWE